MKERFRSLVSIYCMTEKGFSVLQKILPEYSKYVDKVIGSRDGDVQCDYYDSIAELCKRFRVPFFERTDHFIVESEYSIAIGWRWLIKPDQSRLIVFHDSLLPKYRGFSPVVSALINGDETLGVTALYASEEYDRGEIIYQGKIEVTYPIKIQQAIEKLSEVYVGLALKIFEHVVENKAMPSTFQEELQATYSLWRDDDDYLINWSVDADAIKRFIDSVGFPYKYAKTMVGSQAYRIVDAEVFGDVVVENRTPGKVIFKVDSKPVIVCGKGLLKINKMICDDTCVDAIHKLKFRSRFM